MWIFCFNDAPTAEIYTLSLRDALPIFRGTLPEGRVPDLRRRGGRLDLQTHGGRPPQVRRHAAGLRPARRAVQGPRGVGLDRKSTRLNSSHANISHAVFCLKKK